MARGFHALFHQSRPHLGRGARSGSGRPLARRGGGEDQSKIFDKDINKIDENFFQKIKFDLIFLDPPYLEKKYDKILNIIKKCNILNKNHILILHKEKGSDHKSLSNLNVIENRVYGRSQIFFLKLF